jgi:uncharacterized protein YjdB
MHVQHRTRSHSHRFTPRRASALVVVLALATAAACKEAAEPAKVASIVGLPPTDSVRLTRTNDLSAFMELRDSKGNKLTGRKVTWSSVVPGVASVDDNGVVTGVALGSSIITARADGASAQVTMFVQPLVSSVVVAPSSATLQLGEQRTLTVTVTDKNGLALAGRVIEFSSSNPAVATVNASGVVAGVSVGGATINAKAVQDGVIGTATINVVQARVANVAISPAGSQTVFQGTTLQLSATLRDAQNNVLTGRTVNWTTSNPAIATVSSSGLVTGVSLGNVQITAESEGAAASLQVNVQPRPVQTVTLSPNPGTVSKGSQLQMTLDLRDASGNPLTTAGRSIVWESSNRPVATVQDGVVSGVSPGTATITVTVDGKSASASVTVTP